MKQSPYNPLTPREKKSRDNLLFLILLLVSLVAGTCVFLYLTAFETFIRYLSGHVGTGILLASMMDPFHTGRRIRNVVRPLRPERESLGYKAGGALGFLFAVGMVAFTLFVLLVILGAIKL